MRETRMDHPILLYSREDELLEKAMPFLRSAMRRGHHVMGVVAKRTIELLEEALGPDAAMIDMVDSMAWWQGSAHAAFRDYDRAIRSRLGEGSERCLVVGEPVWQRLPDGREWRRYEAYSTLHFSSFPLTSLCLADTRLCPPDVLEAVVHTHPEMVGRGANPDYVDPCAYLAGLDRALWRAPRWDAPWAEVPTAGPGRLRHALTECFGHQVGRDERFDGFLLAVSEVLTLARSEGTERVQVRQWREEDALVCEVRHPRLGLDDLFAGYGPPSPEDWGGWGMWLARASAARLLLDPGRPQRAQVHVDL